MWIWGIAPALEADDLLPLRLVSRELQAAVMHNDVWLNKLTMLSLQYPSLLQMDQGSGESAFSWYWRCLRAVGAGDDLARRHVSGEYPYLQLYGEVTGNSFTPYADMRFPIVRGAIVELIDLMARSGRFADPPMDAALLFSGTPVGVQVDSSFRRIHASIKEVRRNAHKQGTNMAMLSEMLAALYVPRPVAAAAGSSGDAPSTAATIPVPAPNGLVIGNGAPKLHLRLRRMSAELTRANERIVQLEAENARLREQNAQLRSENAELRSENRRLVGAKRTLEAALEASHGELEAAHAAATADLKRLGGELAAARRARSGAARQLDAMVAEHQRLKQLLLAAERRFEKAQAALDRERGSMDEARAAAAAARDAVAAARVREAEVERDAAAQVAAAQHAATAAIEAELQQRILERGLKTREQFVDYAQLEANLGMVSPPFLKVAAHVMAAECGSAGKRAALPPTSVDGRGRSAVYMRVVSHVKASNEISQRQLHRRTQELRASLTELSGGSREGTVAQLKHFIKTNRALIEEALEGTWLSPP